MKTDSDLLPEHWTADQALLVADFLIEWHDAVWTRYAPILRQSWSTLPLSEPRALIPTDWTPEQALEVYLFLADLHQTVWETYESGLIDLILADERPPPDPHPPLANPLDDDLPF